MMPKTTLPLGLILAMALSACDSPTEAVDTSDEQVVSASVRDEPASILRPDIAAETAVEEGTLTESFTAVIGFPSGGSELDADALAELEQVRASTQFTQTGAIILRAHGDSAGSDVANERASEARGLAVAEWLIAAGAEPRRIDVIVFGEQNPTLPNAMPDGSPNEAGRAANRRVEIEILAPPADGQPEAGVSEPGDQP